MDHGIVIQKKEFVNLNYIKWMKSILRRSDEVGKLELPITAVIIDEKGRCIGRGSNKRETNNDPLGHAELIALRQAALIKNDWRFNECTIFVNLEPCTMCAAALVQARMGKVIYGASDSIYDTAKYSGGTLKSVFTKQTKGSGYIVSLQFVANSTNPPYSFDAISLEYGQYGRR